MYRKDLIRAGIVNKDMNLSSFAALCGLNTATARKIWNGQTNIELETLITVSGKLDIPMSAMFTEEAAGNSKESLSLK